MMKVLTYPLLIISLSLLLYSLPPSLTHAFFILWLSYFLFRMLGRAVAKAKLATLTGTKRDHYSEALQQLTDSDVSESDFNLFGLLPVEEEEDDYYFDNHNHNNDDRRIIKKQKQKQGKEKHVKGSAGAGEVKQRFLKPAMFRQYYHPNTYAPLSELGATRVRTSYHIIPHHINSTPHYITSHFATLVGRHTPDANPPINLDIHY